MDAYAAEDDDDFDEASDSSGSAPSQALEEALALNPYVALFLARLDVFADAIDPALAAAAGAQTALLDSSSAEGADDADDDDADDAAADDDADAADDDAADDDADAAADDDDEMTSPARGAFEGSVEEALAYASLAAGCWMDFLPSGVDRWVARRLESAELEWPPRRCASNDAFQRAFVKAAEAADVDDDDAGEQAPDLVEQDP